MKGINKITGILIAILFITSCGKVPLTGRKQILLLSDKELLSESLTLYNDFMRTSTVSTNETQIAMVERIGKNIAATTEEYLKQNGRQKDISNFSFISTHPSDKKRVAEIQRRLPEVEKYKTDKNLLNSHD